MFIFFLFVFFIFYNEIAFIKRKKVKLFHIKNMLPIITMGNIAFFCILGHFSGFIPPEFLFLLFIYGFFEHKVESYINSTFQYLVCLIIIRGVKAFRFLATPKMFHSIFKNYIFLTQALQVSLMYVAKR